MSGAPELNIYEKRHLARWKDTGLAAVGHRCRIARELCGLPLAVFARQAREEPSTIEQVERGERFPSYSFKKVFWRRLGLPDEFIDDGSFEHLGHALQRRVFERLSSFEKTAKSSGHRAASERSPRGS